jgi:hypothetical protein
VNFHEDSFITKYVLTPFYNLVNTNNPLGFIIAWGILGGFWILLYYKAPIGFWNSSDGFIDMRIVTLFSVLLYWVVSSIIIASYHKSGCQSIDRLAKRWAKKQVEPPAWLLPKVYQEMSASSASK